MLSKPVAAVLAALCACVAAGASAAPIGSYGAYPQLEDVAISPDGTKLAFGTFVKGERRIAIQSIADSKLLALLDVGDMKMRGLSWADNDHLFVQSSETGHAHNVISPRMEWWTTVSYSLADNSLHMLMDDVPGAMNVTQGDIAVRHVGGKTIAYVTGLYSGQTDSTIYNALFAIDLTDYRTTLVEHHSHNADSWLIDTDGNVIAEADYDPRKTLWTLNRKQDGEWQTIASIDAPIDTPELSGLSPDGNAILIRTFDHDGATLRAFSATTGAPMDVPGNTKFHDGFIEDPVSHRVIGTLNDETRLQYEFFSPQIATLWHQARDAFSDNDQVELSSWSDDKQKMVLHVFGPNSGDEYILVDRATNSASPIGQTYADIGVFDTAQVKPISYKAADGLDIPAYLTLPRDVPAKNLPLIVFPHGGPAARDEFEFDWWAQAMASRGYAVLQPEFRGSDGYGFDFLSAGFGQWGRKMQTDLSDGVRALAAQGTIDPRRVCIVGASYGGYAALAGATLDTGVYRCAVSDAGISDLHGFLRWGESRENRDDNPVTRYWLRFLGAASDDDPVLDTLSPIKHIDKVTIPILLIHGKDDTVVPIEQSEDMADALKDAGKDVTFVKLDGEDHWLSHAETRVQLLQALDAFLAKNNPP